MTSGLHDAQTPREVDADTGLTVGPLLDDASPAPRPERVTLEGRYCVLQPLDPARHGDQLFTASTPTDAAHRFRYLPDPPPESRESFDDWMRRAAASDDPLMFVVINRATSRVEGRQTLMRITPAHRCIEIGNIYWGPAIAGTR